jgi:hypothetical protein
MSASSFSSIINIINTIMEAGKVFFSWVSRYMKNKKLRKKYKDSEDAVDGGDVDAINDIITGNRY